MSIKRHDEIREAFLYPKYTNQDLDEFGALLDRSRYEVKLKDKTIHPINLDEARVEFGAMSKKFHLGVPVYAAKMEVMEVNKEGTRYKQPDKYSLFQHKYNAWALRKEKI